MISIEKVTLNIGVGADGAKLPKAKKLLEKIAGQKPIERQTKKRIPNWGLRKNMVIGTKVTLRGGKAKDILEKCLKSVDGKVKKSSFSEKDGNFSFGIKSYIDIPGMKYDHEIGLMGLDVCVTLQKWGYRVKRRKLQVTKIPRKHVNTQTESIEFMKKQFGVEVVEE